MSSIVLGPIVSGMTRDDEGHREYKATWIVKVDSGEGPMSALLTPGLPVTGAIWTLFGDLDAYAWCRPTVSIRPHGHQEGEMVQVWAVERTFSTKPGKRCQDEQVEDPLLEPQKISGSFASFKKEATHDMNGSPLLTPSLERMRGDNVSFDEGHPTVRIEQNVASLQLSTFAAMVNCVNSAPLWGCPARTVKLMNAPWERKYKGSCEVYYTRTFEFEIDLTTKDEDGNLIGWDRSVLNEGTRVLSGHWADGAWVNDNVDGNPPDATNPLHFIAYQDKAGNNAKVPLGLDGNPIVDIADATYTLVQKYTAVNFLLLGIPTSF